MTENRAGVTERAAELRRAFDLSFSEAPLARVAELDDLLNVRVGHDPYAIRLDGVAGVFADKPVTPLSSPVAELLGIAGFRGAIVPVYDLHILLGYPGGGSRRWLIVTAGHTPVALAFDQFEGHMRVARAAIAEEAGGQSERHHVREVVRTAGMVRPIVHLPFVLEVIRKRARQGNPQKER